MNPLPIKLLQDAEPTEFEKIIGKIPILGWAIARGLEQSRFKPIVREYKRILKERDEVEALALWPTEDLAIVEKLMEILKDEMGWKHPRFIPDDPCYVAFWSHEDALDVVDATMGIEKEWKIEFSEYDEEITKDFTLMQLITLIKQKSQQGGGINSGSLRASP